MKRLFTVLLALLIVRFVSAQAPNPVNWTVSYKTLSATEGEITITALIEKNWHIYSQKKSDAGLIPTTLQFTPTAQFELVGAAQEFGAREEFDKAFEATVSSFYDRAEFKQNIKLKAKAGFEIKLKVEYMCCNDMMCLPPKSIDLSVKTQ